MNKVEYKEYLQSEQWKNFRKKIFNKRIKECRICKSKTELNLHHRYYSDASFRNSLQNPRGNDRPFCTKPGGN